MAYVTAFRYGGARIWKTANLFSGAPTWTDISGYGGNMSACPHKVYVHELTGDVIASYQQGSVIYPAHVAPDRIVSMAGRWRIFRERRHDRER